MQLTRGLTVLLYLICSCWSLFSSVFSFFPLAIIICFSAFAPPVSFLPVSNFLRVFCDAERAECATQLEAAEGVAAGA